MLDNGVTVIGAGDLPARMARPASTAYARNVVALLTLFVHDGGFDIDLDDEIQSAVVITHEGAVVNPAVAAGVGVQPGGRVNGVALTTTGGTR